MELFHFKVTIFLLVLLFLEFFLISSDASGRCLEEENSTILQLKKGFITGNLKTWKPGTNCCIWEGVACDEYGRIIVLNLSFRNIIGTIDPSLFNLTSLDTLILSNNEFDGIDISNYGWDRLVNLSILDLSYAGFVGKVPTSISRLTKLNVLKLCSTLEHSLVINPMILQNMSSLKELHLGNVNVSSYRDEWCGVLVNSTPVLEFLSMNSCSLFGAICSSLQMLHFLSFIDFSNNNLDSNIPDSFANFSSLSNLLLQGNKFKGGFPTKIFQLRNLKLLDISYNPLLSVYLPDFPEYSNLKSLLASNTNFSGNLPDAIGKFKFLTFLDLSSCQFYGIIPASIWNLSDLWKLDLSHNNFNGVAGLEFPFNTISQSHLIFLSLANNNLTGEITPFICNLTRLTSLNLSKNKLNGTIPSCFLEDGINLHLLNLGENQLHGAIPHGISQKCNLKLINLRDNQLDGEIAPSICNLNRLMILNLSKNKLTGTIPPCLLEDGINLQVLNLRGNQLHGTIPHGISLKCKLQIINLRDNQFDGLLPRSLSNCQSLQYLDLGNNNLKDTFPYWLGSISFLRVLNLRSNKFYGLIGPSDGIYETSYAFQLMQVIDISSNNFSGILFAKFFNNFKLIMRNDTIITEMGVYPITIMIKGQLITLEKYYAISIDFSNNHFEGHIPSIIGQLVSLQVLNLSQNYLTGEIPPELGNLVHLESLDLSRNYLSGKIPQNFISLHFLSYLNLSYNKLVGIVPQGGQLCSFTNTSFDGNEGLQCFCYNTLVPTSNNTPTSPPSLGDTSPSNRNYMIVLGLLFGVGFGGSMAVVLLLDVMFCNKFSHE